MKLYPLFPIDGVKKGAGGDRNWPENEMERVSDESSFLELLLVVLAPFENEWEPRNTATTCSFVSDNALVF